MIILGLTGPTGAGKGVVGDYLATRGALVIDTDRLARDVVAKGSDALQKLVAHFGDDILHEDGTLNRAALAQKAFASPSEKAALEAITHPAIIARSKEMLAQSDAPLAVIDAPLLFESGMDAMCDVTLAVLAPADTRLRRIMARDGITEDAARHRMQAQPQDAFYLERADRILHNDGDKEALIDCLCTLLGPLWEGLS